MAKRILVGNWKNRPESALKMNTLLTGLEKKASLFKKLSVFIAPPYVYFESVSKRVKGFAGLASQDIFFTLDGAHTGVVTPDILKSFGVKLSIVGHSERRVLGETNEVVSDKMKSALRNGVTPVLCIGETERDPEGNHFEFIREQLQLSLNGVRRKDDARKLIIAYEPVWAIGKKSKGAIEPSDLSEMIIFMRRVLTDIYGREAAEEIPILYGGSVDPSNAKSLLGTGIDGFLVGRVSLDAKGFSELAEALLS